jgi:hypothetical protein
MSATEVIELIKKLPPEEQAAVRNFVTQQVAAAAGELESVSRESDAERALRIGRGYIERHPELFRRLAQ